MPLRMTTARKVLLAIVAVVIVALLATATWLAVAPRRVPSGQPPLTTLSAGSLPEFREGFNAGTGETRVLVLLSPT